MGLRLWSEERMGRRSGQAHSQDLQDRVIGAVDGCLPVGEAAALFSVRRKSAVRSGRNTRPLSSWRLTSANEGLSARPATSLRGFSHGLAGPAIKAAGTRAAADLFDNEARARTLRRKSKG